MTEGSHSAEKRRQLRQEYVARLNRVVDHIYAHLGEDLSLESLARVAAFSRFHFHRIFRAMMGETVNQFVQRLRLERAASLLAGYPSRPVTAIALECGFSGSDTFARAFRDAFGMTATQWREGGYEKRKLSQRESKIGQDQSKGRQDEVVVSHHIDSVTHNPTWRMAMSDATQVDVEVKQMPAYHVAYARHVGSYSGIGEAFGRLMKWAFPRGLVGPEPAILGVYHDDPAVTDEGRLQSSACLGVPDGTPVEGEIGTMEIAGGQYAVGHFEISAEEFGQAWDALYGGWLPESGYQCDEGPPYELYLNDHEQHPDKKFIVDICVPVKPM